MTDGAGLLLAFTLTRGQRHELTAFERTLKYARLPGFRGRPRTPPVHLAGGKAYSYRPVFADVRRRRIQPAIPPGKGGNMGEGCPCTFDPELYRRRNVIERCVGGRKGCRSIAIRHEKLAINFAVMVKLAFLRHYLRTLRPTNRT